MWAKGREQEEEHSCVGKEANGGWWDWDWGLVGEGEGCVTIATDWLAKYKQSAAVARREKCSPQCVINLSSYSWCMSYIYTPTCEATAQRIALSPCSQIHSHTFGNYVSLAWNVLGGAASIDPGFGPLFSCLCFLIGLLMAKAGEMKECKMEVCTAGYTA